MEIGLLSLSDLQPDPVTGERFEAGHRLSEIVGYAVLADRLGLDTFALGEHHTLDFAVSSPAVVLAAAAARTSRIRLTTGVTVLPVLDPVRVYQDYATLDLLSGGRADIVVGRSAFTEPFPIFGVRLEDYDAVFDEKLRLLLELRAHDHLTWTGRFRPPLDDAPITPRDRRILPIWVGVGGSTESLVRAGTLGLPMILGYIGGTLAHARRAVDLYRQAGEAAGHAGTLRVGLSTHFYAGGPTARDDAYPYFHEYLRPKPPTGRGFDVDRSSFDAMTTRGGPTMIGTSEELIAKILDAHDALGLDWFQAQVDWGGLPRAMVTDSIRRLAEEIAPAVRSALG